MSKRPIAQKKLNRLRKALNRTPLPAYIELIDWLKFHRHADTTGQAIKLLVDGRVRSESHVIGREKVTVLDSKTDKQIERWVPTSRVPASLRDTLHVT